MLSWIYPVLIAQVLHQYSEVGNAEVFYIFNLVCFWTWEGLFFYIIIIYYNFNSHWISFFKSHCFHFVFWNI